MGSWWEEALNKHHAQPLPQRPAPQIPQTAPEREDHGIDDLVAAAKAATAQMTPAQSVAERFGQAPGAEIGTVSRRPGPTAAPEESLLDLTPQQRQELVRRGIAAGKFDDNGTAKAAHDRAAEVQQLIRDKTFDITEDTQPRRVDTHGVAGATWWNK